MSIFNALVNAVTGLQAQSFALGNISSNIANSQTTGYKRVDTAFEDMVTSAPVRLQKGGSVSAFSRATNTLAGTLSETRVPTHVALDGDGFIAVRERLDSSGGVPRFSEANLFTRRGDFTLDRSGYLVNGAGHYLVGNTLDPRTGSVVGGTPTTVKVEAGRIEARPTTRVAITGNLPATPATAASSPDVPGSHVFNWPGGSSAADVAALMQGSVAGPTVTLYDDLGTPRDVSFRWAKTAETAGGSTWGFYGETGSGWTRHATLSFDAGGRMTAPLGPVAMDLSSLGLGANVELDVAGRLTQFSDATGLPKVDRIEQDGGAMGDFDSLYVSDDGRVMARYTNGQTRGLAQIAVAQFAAADQLERVGGGAFAATVDSGEPLWGAGATTVQSGSLEGSNTDVAEEFTRMIVTQQAYAANTRVISVSQQMLQETLNVVR